MKHRNIQPIVLRLVTALMGGRGEWGYFRVMQHTMGGCLMYYVETVMSVQGVNYLCLTKNSFLFVSFKLQAQIF